MSSFNNYIKDEKINIEPIVETTLDRIDIGGRNLVQGTSSGYGWTGFDEYGVEDGIFYCKNINKGNDGAQIYSPKNIVLSANSDYTISFEMKASSDIRRVQFYFVNYLNSSSYESIYYTEIANKDVSTEWKKYKFNFKPTKNITSGCLRFDNDGLAGSTGNTELWLRRIKLEKGTVATDWTPAPEDIQNGYTWDAEKNSFAVGKNINTASSDYSFAEGSETTASGAASHAEGNSTKAEGQSSHAEGNSTTASGNFSHAEGSDTTASGAYSHAEGYKTTVTANVSHVEGETNIVSGTYSHAEGKNNTLISAPCSHIEGANNALFFSNSHAEGSENISHGYISHIEGNLNTVTGYAAHTEGFGNIASGDSAHVEGGIAYKESNYKYDVELSSATYNSSTGILECVTKTEIPDDKVSSCIAANFHYGTGTWDHKTYWITNIEKVSTTNYKLQLHADALSCITNGIKPDPSTIGTIIKLSLIRRGNIASGNSSHAEGTNTTASGAYSHVEGYNTVASEESAHAEGTRTVASGETAHAEGHQTQAIGNGSHAEGAFTTAKDDCSHAEGSETTAFGVSSHAEGQTTTARGDYSHVEGFETIASGVASHAEGAKYENNRSTESAGQASHAEGASTYAKADGSHAEGILNIAGRSLDEISTAAQELGISGTPEEIAAKLLGYGAHAEGMNNEALGSCSHSEGNATKALANSTHAEGDTTIAFGEASHAEGYNTQAKGNQSHAEGSNTVAEGNSSHAEGVSTVASGSFSHAEGSHTEATGRDSHAEGAYNKANGIASHAEGMNNTAPNEAQHVSGKYATIDETGKVIFQVGIGSSVDDRKDALRIKTDGDIIIRQDDQEIVLQDKLNSLQNQISDVSLFCVDKGEVFLKAPKNTMTHNDRVVIARYIRNKRRNRDGASSTWLTYKGWVRPRKTEGGQSRYFVIPEFSVTNGSYYTSYTINGVTYKFNDTDKYQYWRLTNQGKNLVNFIASNNVCHTGDGGEFIFVNKTLGLCIQRDGVQITDYLKFTIKQNENGGLSFGRV